MRPLRSQVRSSLLGGGGNVTMSQKVPCVADERLVEGLVPRRRPRPRSLDQKGGRRTTDDPRRAVRVQRRRRGSTSRLVTTARRVDRRRAGNDSLDGAAYVQTDDRARGGGRRTWTRRWARVLGRRVDERVAGDDWLRFLDPVFERVVVLETVRRGGFHVDWLRRQRRQRVQYRRRRLRVEILRKWPVHGDREGR